MFNNFWHDDLLNLSWFGSSAWALFSESRFPNSCIFLIADCNKGRLELAMTASMSTCVGKKVFPRFRDSKKGRFRKIRIFGKIWNLIKKFDLVWIDPVQHFLYWWRQKYLWGHLHICFELLLKPSCHYSLFKVKYTLYLKT